MAQPVAVRSHPPVQLTRAPTLRAQQLRFGVLVAVVTASTGYLSVLNWITGFTLTDFHSFLDAKTAGLSLDYLTSPVFGHFVPGHRLINWATFSIAPLSLTATSAFIAGVFALTVLALHRLLADLVRPGALALALTGFFAFSTIQVGTSFWWAAAMSRMPTNLFGVVAILLYLRYRSRRHPAFLAASVLSLGVGLAFAEDAMLVLGVIVALRVLVLEPDRSLRASLADALGEWRVWLLYLIPISVSLVGSTSQTTSLYTFQTPALLLEYLATGWFRLFSPVVLGQYVDVGPLSGYELAAGVVAQVAVVALIAATVARNRLAWRSWAFFAFGYLLTQGPIGILRTGGFETALVAQQYRYYSLTIVIFTIAVATAVRPLAATPARWAGESPIRRWRPAVAVVGVVYVASSLVSSYRAADAWDGRRAKPYVEALSESLRSVDPRAEDFALIDAALPEVVVQPFLFPINRLSWVIPLIDDEVDFATRGPGLRRVLDDGRIVPVRLSERAWGRATSLFDDGSLAALPAGPQTDDGLACLGLAEPVVFSYTLAEPLERQDWFLRITYRSSADTVLALGVDPGDGFVPAPESAVLIQEGRGEIFVSLGQRTVRAVVMVMPADVELCLDQVSMVRVDPA